MDKLFSRQHRLSPEVKNEKGENIQHRNITLDSRTACKKELQKSTIGHVRAPELRYCRISLNAMHILQSEMNRKASPCEQGMKCIL